MTEDREHQAVFHAIADPIRRTLLDLIREQERSVLELARPFPISQPAISQHLRVLREAGLVQARRQGRERRYRLNPRPLRQVYEWAGRYQPFVDPTGQAWAFAGAERPHGRRRGRRAARADRKSAG